REPVPHYAQHLADGVRGLRVGMVRELTLAPETDVEVREAVVAAARRLEGLGAVVEEGSLRLAPLTGAIFMALADSDRAGVPPRGPPTRAAESDQGPRRRLLTASLIPAALHQRAARARALVRAEMCEALARHDLLLCPTAHQAAPPIAAARGAIAGRHEV